MTEPSLATLAAAAALAAFVTGFLRASVGGGIGLALTPVLSLALPAQSALRLTGFMLNLAALRHSPAGASGTASSQLILPTALVYIAACGFRHAPSHKVIGAMRWFLLCSAPFMRAKSTWDITGAWAAAPAC